MQLDHLLESMPDPVMARLIEALTEDPYYGHLELSVRSSSSGVNYDFFEMLPNLDSNYREKLDKLLLTNTHGWPPSMEKMIVAVKDIIKIANTFLEPVILATIPWEERMKTLHINRNMVKEALWNEVALKAPL